MATENGKCPNCGAPVQEGDSFCTNCGAKVEPKPKASAVCANCGSVLPEGAAFCTNCGARANVSGKVNLKKSTDTTPPPGARRCPVCGSEVQDNDVFCTNCGARLDGAKSAPAAGTQLTAANGPGPQNTGALNSSTPDSSRPRPSSPAPLLSASRPADTAKAQTNSPNAAPSPYDDDPSQRTGHHPADTYVPPDGVKTKHRHTALIVAIVVIALCAVGVFIFYTWEGEINYIGSVKAWTPFKQSQDLPQTVGAVMSKYMPDAVWEEKEGNDNSTVVVASGGLLGVEGDFAFSFIVSPDEDNSGSAHFQIRSVTHDGQNISPSDPAVPLLYMFASYDADAEDVADILAATEAVTEPSSEPPAAAPSVEAVVPSPAQGQTPVPAPTTPVPTVMVATPPPAAPTAPAGFDANGLVFPDSSVRYLTREELSGLSKEMLGFARNEIFARNGNLFRKDKYVNHYTSYAWYNNIPNKRYDINPEELNAIEQANIKLIQEFEAM